MQKTFKIWLALACFAPTLVCAQALQKPALVNAAPVESATLVAAPIDPAKRAAIKDLLNAIDAAKLVKAIGDTARIQARQLVPAILSDALAENKTLSEPQKRSLIPALQSNAIPKLVARAGEAFEAPQFTADALEAQYQAYNTHYTIQTIKALTGFYRSDAGREFIQKQDQVGRDVVNGLLQKYMPNAIKAIREQADQEVATAKPAAAAPSKPASKR